MTKLISLGNVATETKSLTPGRPADDLATTVLICLVPSKGQKLDCYDHHSLIGFEACDFSQCDS